MKKSTIEVWGTVSKLNKKGFSIIEADDFNIYGNILVNYQSLHAGGYKKDAIKQGQRVKVEILVQAFRVTDIPDERRGSV